MVACFRCGGESVRSSLYFISSANNAGLTRLRGAAELGLCPACLIRGYRELSRKPLIFMLCWAALAAATLYAFLRGGTETEALMKIVYAVLLILALYNGVRDLIVVSVYRKRIKSIEAFLPEMSQTDFNEQVNSGLSRVERIYHGVIFNYERLRDYRAASPAELNAPAFREAVAQAFDIKDDKKPETRRIKAEDIDAPPTGLRSEGQTLDDGTVLKIYKAIKAYISE